MRLTLPALASMSNGNIRRMDVKILPGGLRSRSESAAFPELELELESIRPIDSDRLQTSTYPPDYQKLHVDNVSFFFYPCFCGELAG